MSLDRPLISFDYAAKRLLRQTESERLRYRSYMESLRHSRSELTTSYQDGLDKGTAEGEARGVEKGKAEGLAEGILQTARKMKAEGMSVDIISKVTGLSAKDINGLFSL